MQHEESHLFRMAEDRSSCCMAVQTQLRAVKKNMETRLLEPSSEPSSMQYTFDWAQFPEDSDSYTDSNFVDDQEDDLELDELWEREDVYDPAQDFAQGPSDETSLGEGAMNLLFLAALEPPRPSSALTTFFGC